MNDHLMYDVRCTVYDVRFTMYDVRCTVYDVRCTMYDVRCTVYDVRCTVYDVRFTVYGVRCTMYGVRCTMYGVRCTMYDVRCTMYDHGLRYIIQADAKSAIKKSGISHCPPAIEPRNYSFLQAAQTVYSHPYNLFALPMMTMMLPYHCC